MRRVRKRRVQKKKGLSFNALLWLTVIIIILFYSVQNFTTIKGTVTKLSQEQASKEPLEATKSDEPQPRDGAHVKDEETKTEEEVAPVDERNADVAEEETTQGLSAAIYFVRIHDDGSFSLVKRARSIEKTQAVLTKTLEQLLQGTTEEEERTGLVHFIPTSSVVKSLSVKEGVAYINMSEAFQFNPFGQAALEAQIYQLVYTSTEFASINKVQVLIEGQKVAYLSGEGGTFLGRPLSRQDLNSALYKQ